MRSLEPRIFRDCLLAGYYCLALDVGNNVTGYGIMSIAAPRRIS